MFKLAGSVYWVEVSSLSYEISSLSYEVVVVVQFLFSNENKTIRF